MPFAQTFASVTETPQSVSAKQLVSVDSIVGYNPDAADVAYLKIYRGAIAPTGSSVPVLSIPFLAGDARQWAVFASFHGPLWIAASTDPVVGLTAPTSAMLAVSVVHS